MKKQAKTENEGGGAWQLGRYEVPMVAQALQVLELVADSGGEVSLADVVARTRITRSSAYRIVRTLEARRYVNRNEGSGDVKLGPRLDEIYRLAHARHRLEVQAEPYMQQLRSQFDETVNLGVLRAGKLVYVRVFESQRRFSIRADEGASAPWHASALGKAVLAFLSKSKVESLLANHTFEGFTPNTITTVPKLIRHLTSVRSSGVARDEEEIELGATCVAVPILDARNEAIAAISISAPTVRMKASRAAIESKLRQACKALSAATA